jgi:hypothetical protein
MPNRKQLFLIFIAVFSFRLFFGLLQSDWTNYDERQSYLTGLKFYTTGDWPYFGPDAAGMESTYHSQIAGPLEGLVIGLPLYIVPVPEAPFIAVNLVNAAAVLFLAWYIRRRIPGMPFIWICAWITAAPWSAYYPSHISNMSYLYFSGILFFVGFLESLPSLSLGLLSPLWANAFMGFSVAWIMQFHLSYVYLLPFSLFSLAVQLKNKRPACLLYFLLGALPPLALVIPTFVQYGFDRMNSHSGFLTIFNWGNVHPWGFITLLARFLSLVCFEVPVFIGKHLADRWAFLTDHPLLFIPGAVLWIGGLLQPFVLLFCWFKRDHFLAGWREIKWLTLASFCVVWGCFWFTIKPPASHIYLVLLPLIMIYSCYCWMFFAGNPKWRAVAKIFVVFAVFFQLGYAVAVAPRDSLYAQRETVAKAIQEKNYHLFGERTPGDYY